ncbi:hypothetical protein CDAR_84631 [Caerostris darwini]|uniref:Uncharacterized protein n=1 Tax=Caerostris darwini TaxID=1538125 RepID=A0AAV4RN32_9ARAC|nr:hypothetical protein CDAR_84631 [Caerostris darwini]
MAYTYGQYLSCHSMIEHQRISAHLNWTDHSIIASHITSMETKSHSAIFYFYAGRKVIPIGLIIAITFPLNKNIPLKPFPLMSGFEHPLESSSKTQITGHLWSIRPFSIKWQALVQACVGKEWHIVEKESIYWVFGPRKRAEEEKKWIIAVVFAS